MNRTGRNTSLTKYLINRNRNQKQKNSQNTRLHLLANARNCPVAFRMAVSPPARIVKKLVGARRMKCSDYGTQEKVNRLRTDQQNTDDGSEKCSKQTIGADKNSPRRYQTFFGLRFICSMFLSEINLTPLVGIPKLHAELRTEIVELEKRQQSHSRRSEEERRKIYCAKLLQEFPILAHCQTILYISEYANNCFPFLSPIIKRNKKGWISRKRNSTFILLNLKRRFC